MDTLIEFTQGIEASGIVIFSLVSIYYGIGTLIIHYRLHHKLLSCCWLTLMQSISQGLFLTIYIFILWELLSPHNVIRDPTSFGATFIRPAILINSIVVAVYFKIRYINEKNTYKIGAL